MLERIELWDWESHEHTLIDGLSPGFNLLFGESNAGKSSVLRALELLGYNDFDPQSVRVGSKFCVVEAQTERGVVRCRRGKGVNEWTVTTNAGVQEFKNIGKAPLKEAMDVLGFGLVTLGDVDVPVNIMDQLESHFLLAGLGSKDASGSVRAQVVDEVSGLSGIEGLIKEVSLDNHRWGREVKQQEDKAKEFRKQKHDATELMAEAEIVKRAGDLLKRSRDLRWASETADSMADEHETLEAETALMVLELARLPDEDVVRVMADMIEEAVRGARRAEEDHVSWLSLTAEIDCVEDVLRKLPDEVAASKAVESTPAMMDRARRVSELLGSLESEMLARDALEAESVALPDERAAMAAADRAHTLVARARGAAILSAETGKLQAEIDVLEGHLGSLDVDDEKLTREEFELMASFDVCPLTMEPIGPECLKRVRIPVLDKGDVESVLKEKGIG